MRKFALLLTCLLLCGVHVVFAQSRSITGTVTDSDDGSSLPGVSVVVKGTTIGTVTDIEGKFTLSVPRDANTLRFSFVGYSPREVDITTLTVVNVALAKSAFDVDEVVVTAMGISRSKKSLGYASASVDANEITEGRRADVISGLSGKVAGVQIASTSSDPGSSNSIIIRGITSLGGSNQPLFIVDGVPMNNSSNRADDWLNGGYDYGNAANLVNPDDVESMTILKGAASTALYGSRAANGVVLITTKSGKARDKGIGIEYNGGLQFATILRLPEFQNEFGMGWDGTHTLTENGSWGPRMDGSLQLWGTVYNNSQKLKPFSPMEENLQDFFETGFRYSNSVSFSGADDKSDFFASFSQISDDGLIPTDVDTYDKYTLSLRGSYKVKGLKVSGSLNYAEQENNFAPTGQGLTIINSLYQVPRDISIVGLKDLTDPFNTLDYFFTPYGITNPYWIIENVKNTFNQRKIYGKFQADYDIMKNLVATYRFGMDASDSENKIGSPRITGTPGTPNEAQIDQDGLVLYSLSRRQELNHDFLLNYSKDFSKFDISALIGANINERSNSSTTTTVTGLDIPTFYNLSNSGSTPSVEESSSLRRLVGVFGELQMGYDEMLYLTLSARNDWSSTLPLDNNSFFYPGATLSFVFTELFPESVTDVLTFGKVRLAYGMTGNDASPYMIDPFYAKSEASTTFSTNSFPLGGLNAFTLGNLLGNNKLSPEITTEYEVGGNLEFFKGRISIDAAYYNRVSNKQIFSLNMDPASGYSAQNMNLGEISNKGVELLVGLKPVATKNFKWNLSWTYTKNVNNVVSLPEELGGETNLAGLSSCYLAAVVGKPIGFKTYTALKDPNGNLVVNSTNGLPQQSEKMEYIGKMDYDYEMGISNTLTYKGLSLGFDIDIRQGGLMFSRTKDISYFVGNAIQTAYNDRNPFIVEGSVIDNGDGTYSENTIPISVADQGEYWTKGANDMDAGFLIDKSFIKLRSVTLSYSLPKSLLSIVPGIQDIQLSVFGNNLLLYTPESNSFIDPEVSTVGNDLDGKFGEFSANPTTRKFGFNVMLKF